jgi:hypothetical protein
MLTPVLQVKPSSLPASGIERQRARPIPTHGGMPGSNRLDRTMPMIVPTVPRFAGNMIGIDCLTVNGRDFVSPSS